jgi:hypothetical protein
VASIKLARDVDATVAVGKSNVHQRDVGKVNGSMHRSFGSRGGSGGDWVMQVLDEKFEVDHNESLVLDDENFHVPWRRGSGIVATTT